MLAIEKTRWVIIGLWSIGQIRHSVDAAMEVLQLCSWDICSFYARPSLSNISRYYWGQSARTYDPTWFVGTATLTQQKYSRPNLGSICSRLHCLNSRPTQARSRSAHGQSWSLKLESDYLRLLMLSLSLARGPNSGPLSSEKPHLYALRKISSRRDPVGSQFRDPLKRTPGGDSSSPAAC
jgi:hypothetical protein